jgi:glycosyltransferase involved in cell wall biosynthesis
MGNPLVSILIPTYNRAHLISETLNSVLEQTYTNWECIIVDDGSTDNTEEIIREFTKRDSRFQYHYRPTYIKKGANACRNYGFELSNGEYINWFDSDDIMLEDFVTFKINNFEELTNMVISTGYSFNRELNILKKIDLNVKKELFKDYTLWQLKIFTPSILFKKSFLLNFELFNLNFHRGQETEFFSRLFYKLPKSEYKIFNEPLFKYRQHQESKSYKNKQYVHRYIKSLTMNSIANLKRGIELKDYDIIEFHYKLLLSYFFEGISNDDKKNVNLIAKQVALILLTISFFKGIKFFFISFLMVRLQIGRTKLKRNLFNIFQDNI